MTWLLPSALAISGVAALAAIALHFIARSKPLAEPLPTARFIPQQPVHARTRSFALTDLVLLLLRVVAILLIGAGVAGPVFAGAHGRVARVVAVDRSRSTADLRAGRDSARALLRPDDVLIEFDSAAAVTRAVDSIVTTGARGSLSAALASATAAAVSLAPLADSVELVLISPFAAEEMDEATTRLRAAWPGRVRLARIAGVSGAGSSAPRVQTTEGPNDAVVAGLSLMSVLAIDGGIRLVRGLVTAADSAWARGAGHVLLHWPAADSGAGAWRHRDSIDAIGGVASNTGTLVARFPRLWRLDGAPVARWADGDPAAVEHGLGDGCIRDVAILLDPASDVTLRAPFRAFTRALLAPCGGERSNVALNDATLATLAGSGPLAAASSFRDVNTESSRWTPWLLGAGAVLLILELAVRRSERAFA
jgi:hypothetical protein